MNKILESVEDTSRLARKLEKCKDVTDHDTDEEKQAWTLANNFSNLERSFHKLINEQISKLLETDDGNQMEEILFDIGDELGVIKMYIEDSEYYRFRFPKEPE